MSEESEQYRKDPPWPEIYFGLFGRELKEHQVHAIDDVVANAFRLSGVKHWEIGKALRYIARHGNHKRAYPAGEEIIDAIHAGRREYRERNGAQMYGPHTIYVNKLRPEMLEGGMPEPTRTETPEEWQRKLQLASRDERWDIIFAPHSTAECEQRLAFCNANSLAYTDRRDEMKQLVKASFQKLRESWDAKPKLQRPDLNREQRIAAREIEKTDDTAQRDCQKNAPTATPRHDLPSKGIHPCQEDRSASSGDFTSDNDSGDLTFLGDCEGDV